MIKYKFLKYTFFTFIFLALLVAVLLIRITYKPLKVEHFLKYIDQDFVNHVFPKDNLNSATVNFNLFKTSTAIQNTIFQHASVDPADPGKDWQSGTRTATRARNPPTTCRGSG